MPALVEARESLNYWESRLQTLPRTAVRKRREAREMVARWRERVNEAERAEYGWMLPSTRARARLLKPGTMVISQPAIPVPLVVTFPFPPWATRKEEVDLAAGPDPFDGL